MTRRVRSGFTLLEMVVALTILSLVLGAISTSVVATQREFARQRDAMKAEDTIRSVEALVVRLLRSSRADPKSVGATVAKINLNPKKQATWDNIRVRSDFNPADGDAADELEDVLLYKLGDTLFVRWRASVPQQRYAYPVKLVRFDVYKLDGTQITDTTLADSVRKVKLTVEVPRTSSSTDVIRRERWVFLRN